MSFEKARKLDNTGHEYEYHKLTRVICDFVNDHTNLEFYGYKDAESKASGCDPKSYPVNIKPETIYYDIPVLDGEGNPVLNDNGEPTINTITEIIPNPIFEAVVTFQGEDLKLKDLFRKLLYVELKEFPQFEGAKDI